MKQPGQPWLLSSPSLTIPGDLLAGRACQWFNFFLSHCLYAGLNLNNLCSFSKVTVLSMPLLPQILELLTPTWIFFDFTAYLICGHFCSVSPYETLPNLWTSLHIRSLPKLVASMINLTRFDCVNLSKLWIKMTPLQHLPCKSTILWSAAALESLINGCVCFLALYPSSKSVLNPMHQGVQKYFLAIAFQMELTSCQWVWYASALQPVADPSSATR
jgi:hypothetical protein